MIIYLFGSLFITWVWFKKKLNDGVVFFFVIFFFKKWIKSKYIFGDLNEKTTRVSQEFLFLLVYSDRFVEKSRLCNHAVQTLDVGIIFS